MSTIAVETTSTGKRARAIGLGLAAAVIAVSLQGLRWWSNQTAPASDAPFYRVTPMNMLITINKDGELQAVDNIDIICQVEGNTTIQQIVKEGSFVKKGDVLVTLDSAAIKQRIEDTTLEVQKAEADLTTAKEMLEIQQSQNAANLEAAEVALTLSKLDLQQYEEGTYPQNMTNARTELEMAEITLKNREEDLAQTRDLFAKGFVTGADVKKAELEVTTAFNALTKAKTALEVLSKYTHEMDLTSKKNAVAQNEQKLSRTIRENASNLSQKSADVGAKTQALSLLKRRFARLEEQLAACTIKAPADGMVVYSSSSDRGNQTPIQEGAQVRERQSLLRLPDTSQMKAVLRIQETQVPKLESGQRANVRIVGVPGIVGATLSRISVLSDNSQRWWNPDLKEYPVDLTLDHTPKDLKPGLGVQAEIIVGEVENALAVPLPALYSAGQDSFVFVRTPEGVKPQKVKVGASNETHVQIAEGLTESVDVQMLQPGQGKDLLEQAGITIAPTTRPAGEGGRRRGGGAPGSNGGGATGGSGGSATTTPPSTPSASAK